MSLKIIEEKYKKNIEIVLEKYGFDLYELNWIFDFESNVLQVLVENIDKKSVFIDFDLLVSANEEISNLLDQDNIITDNYILEVSSAGAERQVKKEEVLINNIGSYFFVKSNISFEGVNEFNAYLDAYDIDSKDYTFSFFIKGKPKKVKLKYEDINFIRFAIKF